MLQSMSKRRTSEHAEESFTPAFPTDTAEEDPSVKHPHDREHAQLSMIIPPPIATLSTLLFFSVP